MEHFNADATPEGVLDAEALLGGAGHPGDITSTDELVRVFRGSFATFGALPEGDVLLVSAPDHSAEDLDRLVGFLQDVIKPKRPDTLFIVHTGDLEFTALSEEQMGELGWVRADA